MHSYIGASVAAVIAVVGLLVYALSTNVKMQKIGEIMFMAGIFAIAFSAAGRTF